MLLIRLLLMLLFVSGCGAAHAQWRRAESPNFVVYSEGSETRLRARIVLLEDFHALLRHLTTASQPASPTKLHVYVVPDHGALRTIRPVSEGIAGYYMASGEGIAAFVNARAGTGNEQILFHEYAHHFMMQYAPAAYPAWYIEGFAEYFSTARFTPRHIDIGDASPGRAYAVTQSAWLPTERVLAGGPERLNREAMAAYYAQSWLMTHYFYSNPERQAALRRYLAASGDGDQAAALQTATGLTPQRFQQELRRYIAGGTIAYRRMQRPAAAVPAVTITQLPASAGEMLIYAAALRVGLRDEDRQPYLARIRTAAARYPSDPLARRTLAHVELLHGDRPAALRLLEALQAETPNDAELMYLRGRLHLENADAGTAADSELRAAQLWFGRAHRADASHFQTLYRFAQSLRQSDQATTENTANVLLLAQQLAPQVTEVRMNAANVLIRRGEIDHAEALLRPILADPHDRSLADAARRMIEQARAGPASTPPAAD